MGRQSRQKRERRSAPESHESKAFREHLQAEETLEDAVARALAALRKAGVGLRVFDLAALCRLARPLAVVEVDGERLPVVVPRGDWITGRDFDMAMFEAGLLQYVRTRLPGDVIQPEAAPGVVRVDHRMRGRVNSGS
jgi:hypothetical protein